MQKMSKRQNSFHCNGLNIRGKLQIIDGKYQISGKFQNNAMDDINLISTNHVIKIQIIKTFFKLNLSMRKSMKVLPFEIKYKNTLANYTRDIETIVKTTQNRL